MLGVVFGVATAIFYSAYLLLIRRTGRDLRRPIGPAAISTAATAVVGALAGVALGELDVVPSWPAHGWLAILGITAQSVGYALIAISLPRLPAVVTSIILLSQPVAAVALAMVLLGEAPSAAQLAGVGLVIVGIAMATLPVARLRDSLRRAAPA
jgi:drug/metabolite transporter (DMT)-like permease